MIYLSTLCGYTESNEFSLEEIYVSDIATTYVLKKSNGYNPIKYNVSLLDLYSMSKSFYPKFKFGLLRQHPDDDAKSLATFISKKLSSVDLSSSMSQKKLLDTLNAFGDGYAQG